MLILAGNKKILISEKMEKEIAKEYDPEKFLYVLDLGKVLMVVYEEKYVELNKVVRGFLYYLEGRREGGMATMDFDCRMFSLEEKRKAVNHYLGVSPVDEKDVEKLFQELMWLRDNLEEPLEIPDEEIF